MEFSAAAVKVSTSLTVLQASDLMSVLDTLAEQRQKSNNEERERQKQATKRAKIVHVGTEGPSPNLQLTSNPNSVVLSEDFAAKADSIGLGGPKTEEAARNVSSAAQALAGSASDVVANRAAIRLANMSAAETLKAEMANLMPAKRPSLPAKPAVALPSLPAPVTKSEPVADSLPLVKLEPVQGDVSGLGGAQPMSVDDAGSEHTGTDTPMDQDDLSVVGKKRSFEEVQQDQTQATDDIIDEDIANADDEPDNPEDAEVAKKALALKVNNDGTVEQEDTVK